MLMKSGYKFYLLIDTNITYKDKEYWLYILTKDELLYLGGIKNINKNLPNRFIVRRIKKYYFQEYLVRSKIESLEVAKKFIEEIEQIAGKIPIRIFEVWITKEELLNY